MSVIVHSVHNNIVPHMATPCCFDLIFGHGSHCYSRHGCHVPCFAAVCRAQAWSCLSTGWALNRCFAWTFGTAAVLAQGGHIQHSPSTPTTGLRECGNDTSRNTGRSGRQNAATRRNTRREERVTVQGPVKKQQPDGMSHRGLLSVIPPLP